MKKREQGFTLIEVVVAFVMLALVLATSFQIFSTGLARVGDIDDYSTALSIARSQLSQATIGEVLQQGTTSAATSDRKFHWTVAVAAFEEGVDPRAQPTTPFLLYNVSVRVAWQGTVTERHVDLSTLVLGRRAP